ncbi:MAG TPA: NlpC/P60 family protein [Pilimelia sp.]|nr:NlpC/P60 family protein [Pilimelia sp.]
MAFAILAALLLAPATAVHAEPSRAEIQQRINRDSTILEGIVEQYNKVNEELKQTKAAAARHAASLPSLQAQLATAEADISHIAVTAYKTGGLRTIEAVLGGERSGPFLDRIGTLDQLARERRTQIAGFTEANQRYAVEKRKLDTALAKQNIQLRDLAARKVTIEADLKKLYELRRQAYGQATTPGSRYTGKIPSISGRAGVAVRFAYSVIGAPYVWAGEGPGYDCSGLTLSAWRAAGKSLPHNAAMQWDVVAHIGRGAIMPGDLIFYRGLGHVALYVGGGKVIHSPTFGRSVTLADMDMSTPYGYGRVR